MSNLDDSNANVASLPLASVTIMLHPGGRIEIRPGGAMSTDLLLAILAQAQMVLSAQVVQQHAVGIMVVGGGVPRAD
ncbi:MAG: hypothetical protein KatS3mg023_3888 [Armatimonadota bacterium]|nr:MAG: hypothetical protein KatS3mg023_3888 [Armatimonadota bacterium]